MLLDKHLYKHLYLITRRYVGKREEKITTEYEKLLILLCFVNEFKKKTAKVPPIHF